MNDLDFLIHKYYESDAVDQTQTSSHWKKYSQTFQVKKLSLGSGGEKKSLTPHSGGGKIGPIIMTFKAKDLVILKNLRF